MRLDKENALSVAQALTATAVSTNAIDLGVASNFIGSGEPMTVFFNVTVAADVANGDETYAFNLISDDAAALSSPTTLTGSFAIARATLTAGYRFAIAVPIGVAERYFGVQYTLGGTTPTLTISAHLVPRSMIQDARLFADAIVPV